MLNHTSAWLFSCKFAAYFQNTILLEHLWRAACEQLLIYDDVTDFEVCGFTRHETQNMLRTKRIFFK